MKRELRSQIFKARGMEMAELVLKNANIINVFTREIVKSHVAIDKGTIIGIGDYSGVEEIDLEGKYLAPGFIDSHVHIESSMSTPSQFAKVIVPRGVTSIIADPHEIANVKGIEGIKYIIEDSKDLPLSVYIALPSCVPSTPFENSGAILKAKDLESLLDEKTIIALGEMMNYPGVLDGDEDVIDKLLLGKDMTIDGHGPMLEGKDLNGYIVAGVKTEHEASTVDEVIDRLRLGMYILLREGSAAKDLKNLIQVVNKDNLRRFLFCTDDKHPEDLIKDGSIDYNIKLAIEEGLDPIDAIIIGTLNAAECYGLKDKGAIAPGYVADLVVIDDLREINIEMVFKDGKLVAKDYLPLFHKESYTPEHMKDTVNILDITIDDLKLKIKDDKANIIKVIPNSLVTENITKNINNKGYFNYLDENISKIVVVERHNKTGNIGIGLIEGFNIKNGAIGSTIAHDSHNIIVVGDSDEDILFAIKELEKIGGGITIVSKGEKIKSLPLEIGGIMTSGNIMDTNMTLKEMMYLSYELLKVNKEIDPFMTLAFMALPVIPKLKITDMGLFNVVEFKFIEV